MNNLYACCIIILILLVIPSRDSNLIDVIQHENGESYIMITDPKIMNNSKTKSGHSKSSGQSWKSAAGRIGQDYAADQSEVYSSGQNTDNDLSSEYEDSSHETSQAFSETKTPVQSEGCSASKSDNYLSSQPSGINSSSKLEDHTTGQSEFSVVKGGSVKLKCTPTHRFSNCKFISPSGKIFESKAKLEYEGGRIQCLCNVEKYDASKVCGIWIRNLKEEDDGEWSCQVDLKIKRHPVVHSTKLRLAFKPTKSKSKHIGSEEAKPRESEEAKPRGSEEAKPRGSEEANPKESEDTKPTGSEETKPTGSVEAKPTESKEAKPTGSEEAKPTGSEEAKPTGSQEAIPTGSEEGKTRGSEKEKPTGSEEEKPTGSEEAKPTGSEEAKPTGSEEAKPKGSEKAKPTGSEEAKDGLETRGGKTASMDDVSMMKEHVKKAYRVLLHYEDGLKYYKVPIALGTSAMSENISKTCHKAGMKSVCNGPDGCLFNSAECLVTPVSSKCANGNLVEFSFLICGNSNPGKCRMLESVFGDSKGWHSPCGVVDGVYCFDYDKGENLISGKPTVLYAFCVLPVPSL